MARPVLWALGLLLLHTVQISRAVHIIYDEVLWTKQNWEEYKIDPGIWGHLNPSDEALTDPDMLSIVRRTKLNSLDGPEPRRTASAPLGFVSGGAAGHSTTAEGFTNLAAVDQAALAAQCLVCQELLKSVWDSVVRMVDGSEPVNEVAIRDLLDDACWQVPEAVLGKHTIRQVEAGAGFATGAVWLVVRERAQGVAAPAPTVAEKMAAEKACREILATNLYPLAKATMEAAKDYFAKSQEARMHIIRKAAVAKRRLVLKRASDEDEYEDPSPMTEDDIIREAEEEERATACRDDELMCASWAAIGECEANPVYMTGAGRHRGHCELSCGVCGPDNSWRADPAVAAGRAAAARRAYEPLRASACAASKACLTVGGAATSAASAVQFVERAPDTTPGMLLARLPGFVLGKPFWALPEFGHPPAFAQAKETRPDPADPVDVALHRELGNQAVYIMGMNGFFRYDLLYKQRIYQFHREPQKGEVTEKWTLGVYDEKATAERRRADARAPVTKAGAAWAEAMRAARRAAPAAAGKAGGAKGAAGDDLPPAPPMLEPLDVVPDQPSMLLRAWPFVRQMYTRGDACTAEGRQQPRRVELRVACSPDDDLHMLVREPDFCSYIIVVFSPALCRVPGYEPVRISPQGAAAGGGGGGGAAAAMAVAAASGGPRKKGPRKPSAAEIGRSPAVPLGGPAAAAGGGAGAAGGVGAEGEGGGAEAGGGAAAGAGVEAMRAANLGGGAAGEAAAGEAAAGGAAAGAGAGAARGGGGGAAKGPDAQLSAQQPAAQGKPKRAAPGAKGPQAGGKQGGGGKGAGAGRPLPKAAKQEAHEGAKGREGATAGGRRAEQEPGDGSARDEL